MKYPPRDAYRCRPPFETRQQALLGPRYLLAIAVVLVALTLAVAGALSADDNPTTAPSDQHSSFSHTLPYSPLPTSGGFQYLGDPQPSPSQTGVLSLSSPSPSARLQVHQQQPAATPAPALARLPSAPAVQVWSQAAVLTPDVAPPVVDQVALPTNVGSLLPTYNPNAGNLQGDPPPATPTPTATPTPVPTAIPTARPTPTPTPIPSSTPLPIPLPSILPTPQPSASAGSQGGCIATKHHPCNQRGETR